MWVCSAATYLWPGIPNSISTWPSHSGPLCQCQVWIADACTWEYCHFKKRKYQVSADRIAEYQIKIIATYAYFLPSLLRVHLCLACQSSWSPTRTTGTYGLSNLKIDPCKTYLCTGFRCSDIITKAGLFPCHLSMNSSLVTSWTLILCRPSGTWTVLTTFKQAHKP